MSVRHSAMCRSVSCKCVRSFGISLQAYLAHNRVPEALGATKQSTIVARQIEGEESKHHNDNGNGTHSVSMRPSYFFSENLA
jgi:hypothetical protein